MKRSTSLFFAFGLACVAAPITAQASTSLVNDQGASAPCIGIGPIGGPVAEMCAEKLEQQGFIRKEQLGATGLTLGATPDQDGVITAVKPGSAAQLAGLAVGDVIESVNGHTIRPTPGAIAAQASFGASGQTLHMKVRTVGSEKDVVVVRASQTVEGAPTSDNPMVGIHPLIDWRGRFVPCMGVGPAGIVAISWCINHFKPYGFIKTSDLGSDGLEFDRKRTDGAFITSVVADSSAAKAGLHPGDEVIQVENRPLTAHLSEAANELMFGKNGAAVRVDVHRGSKAISATLTLAADTDKK